MTAASLATLSIPSGWMTHTYGKAAIAVPSLWSVETNYACRLPRRLGTARLLACAATAVAGPRVTRARLIGPDARTRSERPGNEAVTMNQAQVGIELPEG